MRGKNEEKTDKQTNKNKTTTTTTKTREKYERGKKKQKSLASSHPSVKGQRPREEH